MPFDLQAAMADLKAADEAGDTQKAKDIAAVINFQGRREAMQQQQQQQQQPQPAAHQTSPLHAVEGATLQGAGLGAISPELLTGAGAGMERLAPFTGEAKPVVAGIGGTLIASGELMRTHRVSAAIEGAFTGLVSESAGQTADSLGAGPAVSMGVRLVAGLTTPLLESAGKAVVSASRALEHVVLKRIGQPESISKMVEAAKANLTQGIASTQPQLEVHAALLKGIAQTRQAAEAAAQREIADASKVAATMQTSNPTEAQKIIQEAQKRAQAIRQDAEDRATALEKASGNKLKSADQVLATADRHLALTVGQPLEHTQIGQEIRNAAVSMHQNAITVKNATYQALEKVRDEAVQQREASGIQIKDAPGMKEFKTYLGTKLLNTAKGRKLAEGKADVTEAGIRAAYQKIYDALQPIKKQVGVNEAGNPTYQTFQPTFNAIDQVRRKLGDVAFGKEAEGYDALGQKLAKDAYDRLSKIQEWYAGPAQKQLQDSYAESMQGLSKFGTAAGKKLTAVDRMNAETFVKDPASIPGIYFTSKQGVRDLKELTGEATPAPVRSKAELEDAFQKQTGRTVAQAKVELAGVEMRNNIAAKEGKPAEPSPFTPAQLQMLKDHAALSKKSPFLFHGTTADRLAAIKQQGLQPGALQRQVGVSGERNISLAANEATAQGYAGRGGVVLRVKKDFKPQITGQDLLAGEGSYLTQTVIPPEALEIKVNGKWQSLKEGPLPQQERSLVDRMAFAYTSRQLQGRSAQQAANWLNKPQQTDWMAEIPGLQAAAHSYVRGLQGIEQRGAALTKESAFLAKEGTITREAGQTAAAKTITEGQAAAFKTIDQQKKDAIQAAESVIKSGFPAESVRNLLLKGSPQELETATKYLAGVPGGKTALEGAVRNILHDVPQGKFAQVWEERLKPAIDKGGLIPTAGRAKLEKDVQRVIKAYEPKYAVPLAQKMIMAALIASSTTATAFVRHALNHSQQ